MQSPGTQDVGPMRPLGTINALSMPVPAEMMPPEWGDSRVWWGGAKEGDLHWRGSIPTDVPETPDYDPAPYNDVWLSQLALTVTDESLHHLSLHALDEASANYLSHQLLLHTALPGCVTLVISSPVLCNICPSLTSSCVLCLFNPSTSVIWSSISSLAKARGVVALREERAHEVFYSIFPPSPGHPLARSPFGLS